MLEINKYINNTLGFPLIYHDYETYDWSLAKYGTVVVDPKENAVGIKLKYNIDNQDSKDPFSKYGPSWVALRLPANEAVIIEEQSRFVSEQIIYNNYDYLSGTLHYTLNGKPKTSKVTRQDNFVFEIEKGQYIPGNYHIKAVINGAIEYSSSTKTLKEIDSKHFALNATQLEQGCEIDVYYIERYNVSSPVPRFFTQDTEPENPDPGDFWINPKKAEHLKTKLSMTPYIRYDYSSMTMTLLLRTESYSTITIYKNNNPIITKNTISNWTTLRIPIDYNEEYELTIVGSHDDYLTNTIIRKVKTLEKVNMVLKDKVMTDSSVTFTLQGDPNANVSFTSTTDITNVSFIETSPGTYEATFPRKARSYYINILAAIKGKFSAKIDIILIEAKEPIRIPIQLLSKNYQITTLTSQKVTLIVRLTYNKELTMNISSNYIDKIKLSKIVDKGTYFDYYYEADLAPTTQYVSFMASDLDNNAVSAVYSTSIQPKRTKEINATLRLLPEPFVTLRGSQYQKAILTLPSSDIEVQYDILDNNITNKPRIMRRNPPEYTYIIPFTNSANTITSDAENPWQITTAIDFVLTGAGYIDQIISVPSKE